MDEKETQKPPENKKTVVFSQKPKAGLFHRLLSNRKRKTIALICVLITIAIAASVYLLFIQEKAVVTVAGKSIYKSDILKEESLYKKAWSAAQGEKNKQDNYEVAKKQLTDEAIIITEAKKRGVTVSQQEIAQEYKVRSSGYATEAQFLSMLESAYGWSKDDLLNKINQDLLQSKLENLVVKGYNGTVVYVRYDIYKDNQNLIDVAKAKADEINSQLKNGVKVSDILKTYENDPTWKHPFLGSFEYSDVNASNEKSNFEGREDWQNISGLTKSGDISGVYKSGGGYFGIAILSNKTSGTYDSWDAFINAMMKSSVSFNSTIKTNIIATFKEISKIVSVSYNSIYNQLASILIPPKAGATICSDSRSGCLKNVGNQTCCTLKSEGCALGHMATVKVVITDLITGEPVSDATITMKYNGNNASDLCPSQFDASAHTATTNSNGVANFYLGCWIYYTISFSHPKYESSVIDAGFKPSNGVTTNKPGTVTLKTWTLTGTSTVQPTAKRGDTVTFTHTITNTGPDDTTRNVSSAVVWGTNPWNIPVDGQHITSVGTIAQNGGSIDSNGIIPSGGNAKRYTYVTIPNDGTVKGGDVICQQTTFNNRTQPSNGAWDGYSGQACAIVFVPPIYTLTPNVNPINPNIIEEGEPLYVTTTMKNSGPDASGLTNWKLYRKVNSETYVSVLSGTASFPVGGPYAGPASYTDNGTGGLSPGDRICFVLSVMPHGSSDPAEFPSSPEQCAIIGNKPKIQILGGDLIVGKDVDTSTSTKNNVTYGSWAEYGIIAAGGIKGAASGAAFAGPGLAGSYTASNSSYLSFANTSLTSGCSPTQPTITPTAGCYKSEATISDVAAHFPITSSPVAVSDIATLSSGTYKAVGNMSISPNSNIAKDHSIIINAKGFDVTITKNIIYDKADDLTSINQVPQVVIIANNIKIEGGVTNIDAWLIAQGGYINTCSEVAIGGNLSSNICKDKLVVNGSVMTDKLYLYRTAGSGTGANSGDPAEVFNLPADAYLWAMAQASTQKNHIQTVYTTELPPRY